MSNETKKLLKSIKEAANKEKVEELIKEAKMSKRKVVNAITEAIEEAHCKLKDIQNDIWYLLENGRITGYEMSQYRKFELRQSKLEDKIDILEEMYAKLWKEMKGDDIER